MNFVCYSVAIQAISAYLDSFQKIADAATNARGEYYNSTYSISYLQNISYTIFTFCIYFPKAQEQLVTSFALKQGINC